MVEEAEVINRDTLAVIVRKRPQMETGNLLDCYVNLRREMDTYMKYLDAWKKKAAIWEPVIRLYAGSYNQPWKEGRVYH